MGIISWIFFGGLVGWAASMMMGVSISILWDIIVGIIGSMLGGFIMTFLGVGGVYGFNLYSFLVAIFGACVFITLVRAIK